MFADYQRELYGREMVLIPEIAFATYEVNGDECYIVDIYVEPEARQKGYGRILADKIMETAREKGCKYLTGTTDLRSKTASVSMMSMLAYGFYPVDAQNKFNVFRRDIPNG